MNTVRHCWAPQFRPNSLPTSKPTVAEPRDSEPKTLFQAPQRCLPAPSLAQGLPINGLPDNQKVYPRFRLSAFLNELTSPDDCQGYWPPKNPASDPASPPQTGKAPDTLTATSSAASAQATAAAAAACCAPVLNKPTMALSSHAARTQQAVPATPPLPTNTIPTYRRLTAFGVPPFTPFSTPNLTPPTFTLPPTPTTLPRMRSPPSLERQKQLKDFLDMGHAHDCWCSSLRHLHSNSGARTVTATVDDPCYKSQQAPTDSHTSSLGPSDAGAAMNVSQASDGLPYLLHDPEDGSSDSDAVLVTPSSESTGSGLEDVFAFEEGSQLSGSEDEEWIAVSRRLPSHRPGSLSSSRTRSVTSVQTSDFDPVVASPTTSLPSPPQTPVMLAYQASVSDAESETV